ncbi:hypothetical protein AB0K09_18255 [Streptomyces sp. NPDC049577]|uniref:hypothetical protein n=1 Tax=Streptomyces sp. NPDC049577 TaxID=3155153 RepID=UPI00344813F2
MTTPRTAPRIDDIPATPVVILSTTGQVAFLDGAQLYVPDGVDPRVVAAQAAILHAQGLGRAVRAELHDADGQRWPMIITPEGGVFQGNRPLPSPTQTPQDDAPAPANHQQAQPMPGPAAQDVDPENVPAWPLVTITMTPDGAVLVNDAPVPAPEGVDARAAGVAAAADHVLRLGLARPVRAQAIEPDGTVWPLLIHPDGTASPAGDAIRPERRRWLRRRT